jgi:hypothetical protein
VLHRQREFIWEQAGEVLRNISGPGGFTLLRPGTGALRGQHTLPKYRTSFKMFMKNISPHHGTIWTW